MTQYILAIAGAVLLSAVFTMLLPSGKMHAFLRGLLRVLILILMISPLISLLRGEGLASTENFPAVDEEFLAACTQLIERRDEAAVEEYLRSEYAILATVRAIRAQEDGYPLQKIIITIEETGINGGDAHIDSIEELARDLKSRFQCEVEIELDQAVVGE